MVNIDFITADVEKYLCVEKPTHVDPVRRFHLTLETIFWLTHAAKIDLTLLAFALQGFFSIL